MADQSSSLDFLRLVARAQGVEPEEADLERVRGFLEVILPALEEIERRLPPETPVE
jgi:hypothetical protein